MCGIFLKGISKSFLIREDFSKVLSDINVNICSGEVVAIRGDNGTGKTTLLNIISGIYKPTQGNMKFTFDFPNIGFVPQDYNSSLLPWYNVANNISLPLRLKNIRNIHERIYSILDKLGFNNLPLEKYPFQLSGGQKQRVAIARALINDPNILILDEPFANLDAHTQIELQEIINRIHSEKNLTIIFVSHELDHCIYIADKIIFLEGNPSTIKKIYNINLSRPRTRNQLFSLEFVNIRAQINKEEYEFYAKK